MHGVDGISKKFVRFRTLRWDVLKPFVVAASRHFQDVTEKLHWIVFSLGLDERIALYFCPAK